LQLAAIQRNECANPRFGAQVVLTSHRQEVMTSEEIIAGIKQDTFGIFKNSTRVWIIEERGAEFVVHSWSGPDWKNGAGVGPPHEYPTLRKAAARLLQILGVGAVAPQTWPEETCIGTITMADEQQV
jgi:hypothetical protein